CGRQAAAEWQAHPSCPWRAACCAPPRPGGGRERERVCVCVSKRERGNQHGNTAHTFSFFLSLSIFCLMIDGASRNPNALAVWPRCKSLRLKMCFCSLE